MYYNAPLNWFAVAVKSRQEKLAARTLRDQGLEDYLPLYRARRRWSDRLKEVKAPLFSGYVFCRFALPDRAPVSDAGISALRQAAGSHRAMGPWSEPGQGQPIRIERGPLSGLRGVLVDTRRRCS